MEYKTLYNKSEQILSNLERGSKDSMELNEGIASLKGAWKRLYSFSPIE